ncbi:MAG: PAS domain S-box protein, partial [Nitrospira sp.]|nr:PAS domain S-box protein [Nitrospira sp.]
MTKKPRILIVDDEIDVLTPLCEIISKWGYDVAGFTSGNEALQALKEQDFDLLMVDLMLPDINGINLMKSGLEKDPNLVCIIFSGKGTIHDAVEAMKAGAFDYIVKPVDFKMMKLVVARAIEVHRLKEMEERYRSIVEYQTEFICRFLPDCTLTFVNEAYARNWGKTPQEMIGINFLTLIPESFRENMRKYYTSFTIESSIKTVEHEVLLQNGAIRWQRWTDRAFFDNEGNLIEFQGVGRDITERKHAEEALQESEVKHRAIFENTGTATLIIEEDMTISLTNMEFEKISGHKKQEVENKMPFTVFVHHEDLERLKKYHLLRRADPDS